MNAGPNHYQLLGIDADRVELLADMRGLAIRQRQHNGIGSQPAKAAPSAPPIDFPPRIIAFRPPTSCRTS